MQRYNEFGPWLKNLLGMKVQKISINAGFTCPNRDGSVGVGGCTYCNNQAILCAQVSGNEVYGVFPGVY